jgi:4-alpha-glucanotransferase
MASDVTLSSPDFQEFLVDNQDWLRPYSLFCVLRDRNKTVDQSTWPAYSTITQADVTRLSSPGSEFYAEASFWFFVQYHLHLQLSEAVRYARAHHVVIKGDLPIGVSRCSVDVWLWPTLFNVNAQAGAPPDYFAVKGQNWGFPTYNWDTMALDNYGWWRMRLKHMARYFQVCLCVCVCVCVCLCVRACVCP